MANRTHIRLAAAVAAMLSVTAIATPALADVVTNFPGGYSHTWTGDHGEDFTVVHWNNTGRSTTSVDRHDGNGRVPFVTPPKPPVTKPYGGSLYNPDTNKTTSIIRGPGGAEVSMVEDNNTLPDHDFWWPGTAKGRSKGTGYNPATDKTITEKWTPEGFMRVVEDGNTMRDHEDMVMRRDPGKMPGGGKKPGKHTGHSSGSVYDPDTNMTTSLSTGPTGWARSVEMGNTLYRH